MFIIEHTNACAQKISFRRIIHLNFVGTLCLILLVTSIAGHYSSRLNLPPVIGQLLMGIIFGPAVLNVILSSNLITTFSEIGILILMFIGGLESDLSLLKKYLTPSLLVAILGMVIPFVSVYITGIILGINVLDSVFLGVVFTATSVSISVEILKNKHYLNAPEGATILGAAVVDDILSIFVLSLLISINGGKLVGNTRPLGITIILQILFFITIYVFSRWIVPTLMKIGSKWLLPVSETIMALIICFFASYIADKVGLSGAIGAFFSGLSIGQTKYRQTIIHNITPIGYGLFIPIFFISVGLSMSLKGISTNLMLFIVLTLVSIFSKWGGASLGASLTHFKLNSSFLIGAGMISRGEMALIIAQMGFNAKLLSNDVYSVTIAAIVVTTIIAPFILSSQIDQIKA